VSRPIEQVLSSVREQIEAGSREVVITGVNISRYRDGDAGFSELLARILDIDGDFRIRISSMEPDSLDERFFELLDHPKMTPHLHLCLQSGSERVLLQMRRQYTCRGYREMVEKIRTKRDDFNLTTDVIVGFPGERDDDFAQTATVCREVGFSHIHTFPYSRRTGTRAERMDDHVPEEAKRERAAIIREISDAGKRRYRSRFIGSEQLLLVEQVTAGGTSGTGYGEHYLPIELSLPHVRRNEFYRVKLTGLGDGDDPLLTGVVVSGPAPFREFSAEKDFAR